MDYCPEMNISDPLDPKCLSFYQHLIGVMQWMVELGPVDIATKISLLSSHLAYPCVGHLEVALHVMGYLKKKTYHATCVRPDLSDQRHGLLSAV